MKALATIATGRARWHFTLCKGPLKHYARRHGYRLVIDTPSMDRPPSWGKISVLQRLLDAHETVVWVDADTVIVDGSADIADEVHGFLGLATHRVPSGPAWPGARVHITDAHPRLPNAGVLVARQGALAQRFLGEVWAQEDLVHHPWWEQAAILRVLGYDLDTLKRSNTDTPYSAALTLLDNRWNSVDFDPAPKPAIKHYPAAGLRRRLWRMGRDRLMVSLAPSSW